MAGDAALDCLDEVVPDVRGEQLTESGPDSGLKLKVCSPRPR
ncbi:hypothetical protein [Streptomyces adustus]|nr:hypothetical protein [Streptomyces adustus]